MTLDDVVKELIAYREENRANEDTWMQAKLAGIDRALKLLANVASDPPAETELERRAWEIFSQCDFSPEESFDAAQAFIEYRERKREADRVAKQFEENGA